MTSTLIRRATLPAELAASQAAQDAALLDPADAAEGVGRLGFARGTAYAGGPGVELKRIAWAEQFPNIDANGLSSSTAGIVAAISSLRTNGVVRLDTIGGTNISMYRSGELRFGPGVFKIEANTLQIVADMGLTLRGAGSRRFTNAVKGRTTLLVTGAATSAQYGISLYRNGARSLNFVDLDICYESNTFLGHLIDAIDAPSLKLYRCYVGTFGDTGGTRLQTAASLLRLTYDEDVSIEHTTMDGAVDGIWSDDVRTELGNGFGGWGLTLRNCTFYDFTGTMVRHDGARNRSTVTIDTCAFNPINVNCVRAINLDTVDAFSLKGSIFTASVAAYATAEWLRLSNVTGQVHANNFTQFSKCGTLGGHLVVSGNVLGGDDGFTYTFGTIKSFANRVRRGTKGFELAPIGSLACVLGPDHFSGSVTTSYSVPLESANHGSRIEYAADLDGSVNGFQNASDRVRVENVDCQPYEVLTTPYSLLKRNSGRTARANGLSAQVFELGTPQQGVRHRVVKTSTVALTINAPASKLLAGTGAVKTSLSAAAADVGGWAEFESLDGLFWVVSSRSGTWTAA